MILTKDDLLRKLDEFEEQLDEMRDSAHRISEELRPIEEVDTETWGSTEWHVEEINRLAGRVARLRRDVLSDL